MSDPTPARRTLIFDWSRRRLRRRSRIGVFIALSIAAHLAFFYLFKIVYPAPERLLPIESRITILHPSNPTVVALLNELDDRTAALIGSLEAPASRSLQLEAHSVTYQPSFAGYEPALKPWPVALDAEPVLPPLGDVGITLPPVKRPLAAAPPPVETVGPATPRQPRLRFGGDLQGRPAAPAARPTPAAWSGSGSGSAQFMLGVEPSGRVAHRLPLDTSALSDPSVVDSYLDSLRFEPSPGAPPIVWGTVDILW